MLRLLISRIKIIVRLNTKPGQKKQSLMGINFELDHKKSTCEGAFMLSM